MNDTFIFSPSECNKIWLISDTHFDHKNIIRYTNRPFSSVQEMNDYMYHAWIMTVNPNDYVFFLGDMAMGTRSGSWWADKLPGRLIWIRGNHDRGGDLLDYATIICDPYEFLLIHRPEHARGYAFGNSRFVIYGHVHNNQPFYDPRIGFNVSVEAIGYKPISFCEILKIVKGIK